MNKEQLMLIDVSGLAHSIFHVSGNQPDPSFISTQIIVRVRAIASQHPHAAISTGPRREPDIDLGVLVCDRCGKPVTSVYTLADVGVYCSAQCREKAVR